MVVPEAGKGSPRALPAKTAKPASASPEWAEIRISGSIALESDIGKSSTSIIRLPLASDSGAAARAA